MKYEGGKKRGNNVNLKKQLWNTRVVKKGNNVNLKRKLEQEEIQIVKKKKN